MKHRPTFIAALWWVILCLIAGVLLLIYAPKAERESDTENRMLAGFPETDAASVFSGDFGEHFEDFLSDGFFFRDGVTSLANRTLSLLSAESEEEKEEAFEVQLQGSGEELETPPAAAAVSVSAPAPAPLAETGTGADENEDDDADDDETEEILSGAFPITEDKSYTWIRNADGTLTKVHTYYRSNIETFIDTLEMIRAILPEDGQICFTEVPLARVSYRWTKHTDIVSGWGSSMETMFRQILEERGDERIHVFNTYEITEPHMLTSPEPLFYSTDHHWSAEGAYLVFSEMMKAQGLPVVPFDEYEYKENVSEAEKDGVRDTFRLLYPLYPVKSTVVTGRTQVKTLNFQNYNKYTYRSYINGSRRPWRRIFSASGTGRKALVLCDSFGNSFTPFLMPYYDEVHMADYRKGYYHFDEAGGTIAELIQYYGIDDVYVIVCISNGLRKDNSLGYLRYYLNGAV